MALTAFTSFSLLVAVSVAVSSGTVTAPWQPAMAHDAQGPQQVGTSGEPGGRGGRRRRAAGSRASLFASVADQAAIDESKVVGVVLGGGQRHPNAEGAGRHPLRRLPPAPRAGSTESRLWRPPPTLPQRSRESSRQHADRPGPAGDRSEGRRVPGGAPPRTPGSTSSTTARTSPRPEGTPVSSPRWTAPSPPSSGTCGAATVWRSPTRTA